MTSVQISMLPNTSPWWMPSQATGWSKKTKWAHCWLLSNTLWGKLRWLRLPFGLSISSYAFHGRLDAVIMMVPDVAGIADDVLSKGNNEVNYDTAVFSQLEAAQTTTWSSILLRFNSRQESAGFLEASYPRCHECRSRISWSHLANGYTWVQKGRWKLPRHGKLPEVLLWLADIVGRTTKRASEK